MIAGIGAVILLAIMVAGFFAMRYHLMQKMKASEKIDRLEYAYVYKMRILKNLLHMKNKTNYKARLMEELNMEIEMLKVCVAQLKAEKLITEGPHNLTLTPFGKQYAEIYAKQFQSEDKEKE
jgi:predicted transcriptional regulator